MTAVLTEADVRALRAQGDIAAAIRRATADARVVNARRRAAVLAHPDLAERLTAAPLGFSRPEAWSGFVPPERLADGARNPAVQRAALVALIDAAEARSRTPQGAAA